MARYAGTNLFVSFKGTAISADYQELTAEREMKMAEVTAGADAAATYVNLYKDGSIKFKALDIVDGTAVSSIKNMMVEGASGTLIWGEEGTATGKPKHTIVCLVKKLSQKLKFDDKAELEIELQTNATGFITDGVW